MSQLWRIGIASLLVLGLCFGTGVSAMANLSLPGAPLITPIPLPVLPIGSKAEPGPTPASSDPPWAAMWREVKMETGWAPQPADRSEVARLIESGDLPRESLVDPEYEFYVRPIWVSDAEQAVVVQTVLLASKNKKRIAAVAGFITSASGVVLHCSLPYLQDLDLRYDPDDQNRRPPCSGYVRDLFGDDTLAKEVDQFFGNVVDEVVFAMRAGDAMVFDRVLVTMTKDSTIGMAVSRAGRKVFTMDVPPSVLSGRMMIPVRYLEQGGLKIAYIDGSITISASARAASYHIGEKTGLTSDGHLVVGDIAPFIRDGRTMMPLRLALSPFCSIDYQGRRGTVLALCVP